MRPSLPVGKKLLRRSDGKVFYIHAVSKAHVKKSPHYMYTIRQHGKKPQPMPIMDDILSRLYKPVAK